MSYTNALAEDVDGNLEAAAGMYEDLLEAGDDSIHVTLSLALLYWQSTDPGLSAANSLRADFVSNAGRRAAELIDDACRRFPGSTAVRFWKKYIDWADLGEPFGVDECKELLREDPNTLVPSMHVFALTNGEELQREALELLRRCHKDGTTGSRYVASVIEGVLRRASHLVPSS